MLHIIYSIFRHFLLNLVFLLTCTVDTPRYRGVPIYRTPLRY
jgi:hypothetical protein